MRHFDNLSFDKIGNLIGIPKKIPNSCYEITKGIKKYIIQKQQFYAA
jgi:hypothetical protein